MQLNQSSLWRKGTYPDMNRSDAKVLRIFILGPFRSIDNSKRDFSRLTAVKKIATRARVAVLRPIRAPSTKSRDSSGRYSERAVLTPLSASTSSRRRQ